MVLSLKTWKSRSLPGLPRTLSLFTMQPFPAAAAHAAAVSLFHHAQACARAPAAPSLTISPPTCERCVRLPTLGWLPAWRVVCYPWGNDKQAPDTDAEDRRREKRDGRSRGIRRARCKGRARGATSRRRQLV